MTKTKRKILSYLLWDYYYVIVKTAYFSLYLLLQMLQFDPLFTTSLCLFSKTYFFFFWKKCLTSIVEWSLCFFFVRPIHPLPLTVLQSDCQFSASPKEHTFIYSVSWQWQCLCDTHGTWHMDIISPTEVEDLGWSGP